MQFFILLCILTGFYATQRKVFYYTTIFLSVAAITIQLIIINTNDLKASYLTYQDEYWTLYYYKPYTRIHGYLVGVWFGCIFYSYKHETPTMEIEAEGGEEDEEEKEAKPKQFINDTLTLMKNDSRVWVLCCVLGVTMQVLMVLFHKKINNNPNSISTALNLIFLLIARPLFVSAFAIMMMPILLGNKSAKPISRLLSHEFWIMPTRLVYGVFLCNSVIMQFYIYDSERGIWIQDVDVVMLFFSFLLFSFVLSFFFYVLVEGPFALLLEQFQIVPS